MATMTNDTATNCHDCETPLLEGEGTKPDTWHDYYLCAGCQDKRVQAATERKRRERRQGSVSLGILPTLQKMGAVLRVDIGEGQYYSLVKVVVDGHVYSVQVTENDDE